VTAVTELFFRTRRFGRRLAAVLPVRRSLLEFLDNLKFWLTEPGQNTGTGSPGRDGRRGGDGKTAIMIGSAGPCSGWQAGDDSDTLELQVEYSG
jgi:hypothetical protein